MLISIVNDLTRMVRLICPLNFEPILGIKITQSRLCAEDDKLSTFVSNEATLRYAMLETNVGCIMTFETPFHKCESGARTSIHDLCILLGMASLNEDFTFVSKLIYDIDI